MASARRLVLKARHVGARLTDDLRRRLRPPRAVVPLGDVHRRLELFLAAMYGRRIAIVAAEAPPARWWLRQPSNESVRSAGAPDLRAESETESIQLPAELPARGGSSAALERYRLLAVEQAERVVRGTAALVPAHDLLVRDLYLLREGAVVDAAIARANAGLRRALEAARAAALAERPSLDGLRGVEREVESLTRRVLGAGVTEPPAELAAGDTPADSLAWARETAARLRALPGPYRGLPAVSLWGAGRSSAAGPPPRPRDEELPPLMLMSPTTLDVGAPEARSRTDPAGAGGASPEQASDGVHVDDAKRHAPHRSPSNGGDPETGEGAGEVSTADAEAGRTADASDAPAGTRGARVAPTSSTPARSGTPYPEWDYAAGAYRPRGVVVREREAAETDDRWALDILAHHATLVGRVRKQFEQLRARRTRLHHQREGDELDLAACVRAIVDRRSGHSPDDRLYIADRPARRGLAIALLADASGSTDVQVTDTLQIIDVEKIALLLASEALDALGDPYALLTFTGKGADDVRLTRLKDFAERNGERTRRRISALAPGGFTRLGAAVRHATALLGQQPAGHRLLLLLSDGRPNDVDHYRDRYGVEDARQAIAEGRACGVYPFCLTVDREGAEYLPRIFGAAGHTILRRPEQLPLALLGMVRHLLRSS